MSDEPTLPRITRSKAAEAIFGSSRKRGRPDLDSSAARQLLFNNSSDPAVFSSDDDPALDNYATDPATGARARKKKRYVGAWFAQHPDSTDSAFDGGEAVSGPPRSPVKNRQTTLPLISSPMRPQTAQTAQTAQKRTFERQFDSGVFIDKEGPADDANGAEAPQLPRLTKGAAVPVLASIPADDGPDADFNGSGGASPSRLFFESSPPPPSNASTSSHLSLAPPPPMALEHEAPLPAPRLKSVMHRVLSIPSNAPEFAARNTILDCVEAGKEDIELMGMELTTLSNGTVEPLAGLMPIPDVSPYVPFTQKDPKLKVFLSNNPLQRLPGALFHLEHLTVLSLRNCHLTELPSAIGKLKNLRSLNVSLNLLHYLPGELLGLFPDKAGDDRVLGDLLASPNPFFTFHDAPETTAPPTEEPGSHPWKRRVARSPVVFRDGFQKVLSEFSLDPPARASQKHAQDDPHTLPAADLHAFDVPPIFTALSRTRCDTESLPATSPSNLGTRVPTLLEMALETCYNANDMPGQIRSLQENDAPPHLVKCLKAALALREEGGHVCPVCQRAPVVAPMTEWIEWWQVFCGQTEGAPARKPQLLPFIFKGCSWGCAYSPGQV